MLAVWNDPAFIRNVADREIRTAAAAREAMTNGALRMYAEFGYGPYGMALRSSNEAIGICGLFRREGLEDTDIGYAVLPAWCGQGYAYEAATAVIGHARDTLGLTRLTAIVSPHNVASIKLTEKLGLRYENTILMPGSGDEVNIYAISLTD
jgi:RimJ/RimL family protein N-acetyltransferase